MNALIEPTTKSVLTKLNIIFHPSILKVPSKQLPIFYSFYFSFLASESNANGANLQKNSQLTSSINGFQMQLLYIHSANR